MRVRPLVYALLLCCTACSSADEADPSGPFARFGSTQDVIRETLLQYLADNGWASNTASMGNVMESEFAVSFDWLGLNTESGRFVEVPGLSIGGGLLMSRDDPRGEELFELPREVLDSLYPSVSWPPESALRDSIGLGPAPDTIRNEAPLRTQTPGQLAPHPSSSA